VATSLDQLTKGDRGRIVEVVGDGAVAQRLLAMGVLPGQTVSVVSVAPLGDPIAIDGPNGRVSLRRREAQSVIIEAAST
jgi:ferrous iron transport protein A